MLNIIQVCQMGEGRLVAPPTEDTGLRVAWSRFERRFVSISSCNSGNIENSIKGIVHNFYKRPKLNFLGF